MQRDDWAVRKDALLWIGNVCLSVSVGNSEGLIDWVNTERIQSSSSLIICGIRAVMPMRELYSTLTSENISKVAAMEANLLIVLFSSDKICFKAFLMSESSL